ncbi:MAG: phosphatidate cytidylyltransferase [Chloroflexota bacterium]|nr:phosphatidate cytidylyltransferase [Dehalococcoidia bacterium]MDW8045992.1 phosphatidate cytidylyltransferase [Chloroflexota bacterium]
MTGAAAAAGSPGTLTRRLLTAAVGLPLLLALVWVGGWPFAVACGVVAVLASAEFVHGWLLPTRPVYEAFRLLPGFAITGVMVAGSKASWQFIVAGLVLAAMFALAGFAPAKVVGPRKPYRVLAGCILYVGVLGSTVVLVREADHGRAWVILGFLATFTTDTGAYAVGRLLGRHKLAPRISPKKTWEGAIGGYIGGFVAVLVLNGWLDTGVNWQTALHLAVPFPLAAITGDLFESWMKRRMGVKDASRLLPGHGGFLDRLDSLILTFPLLYLFVLVRAS